MTYHHGNLKQALLDRAAEVIADQGIEALSLRALARDVGVSHAAPARHFRDKKALLSGPATEGDLRFSASVSEGGERAGAERPARAAGGDAEGRAEEGVGRPTAAAVRSAGGRSEEHTSELQSLA